MHEACVSTYAFAIVVEESLQLNDIRMAHDAHDLQLAILLGESEFGANWRVHAHIP